MIEADDVTRFRRHARTFGEKIDDADALRQAAEILADFEDAYYEAVGRLNERDRFSWRDLGRGAGCTGATLHRKYARWRGRRDRRHPRPVSPSANG